MVQVSVVMSVYNAEDYLNESIESILKQTFKEFEFIIINDGSSDRSKQIIESYKDSRIVLIDQPNQGLSKALNNGIRKANGKYIARMDADDISHPERLYKQFFFLENNTQCVAIGSNADFIDMKGNFLYTSDFSTDWFSIKRKLPDSPFFHSSTMFIKSCFWASGGYREDIKHHMEDKILWNMISKFGELRNLPDSLLKYRLVPSSISNKEPKVGKLMNEIINKIIATGKITNEELDKFNSIAILSKENKKGNYYLRLGKVYLEYNFNRKFAIYNFFKSLSYSPFNMITWFNLALCCLPQNIITKWKDTRLNLK